MAFSIAKESQTGVAFVTILFIALAMRLWSINDGLEQDEFGAVYAVAERISPEGISPGEKDALVPVQSWQEVKARSVFPYGITNSLPLYHYLLYLVIHLFPIAEWSLRLPSLVAGLGIVIFMFVLGRRIGGSIVGLVAALLTALDPMQVGISNLARPFALANLACVLSFLALVNILRARRNRDAALAAFTYGLNLALIAYLNPLILLAGVAHIGIIFCWWFGLLSGWRSDYLDPNGVTRAEDGYSAGFPFARVRNKLFWWFAGCALSALLVLPALGYIREIGDFTRLHRTYLDNMSGPAGWLIIISFHNLTFLIAFLTLSIVRMFGGKRIRAAVPSQRDSDRPVPASHFTQDGAYEKRQPGGAEFWNVKRPEILWMGWLWLILPQVAGIMMTLLAAKSSFCSRYFTYTMLGGELILAYLIVRNRSVTLRIVMTAATASIIFLWGLTPRGQGLGLTTPLYAQQLVHRLNRLDEGGLRQSGDMILLRGAFLEADFVPDQVPSENLHAVQGAILAPVTTLYVMPARGPLVCLSLSNRRGETGLSSNQSFAYQPERFYNDDLARKLQNSRRFWLCDPLEYRDSYLQGFLLWLANARGSTVRVTMDIESGNRAFIVHPGMGADEFPSFVPDHGQPDRVSLTLIEVMEP
jgi:hypothetical protein